MCVYALFAVYSARKRDASPSVNSSPNLEDKRAVPAGPKFGELLWALHASLCQTVLTLPLAVSTKLIPTKSAHLGKSVQWETNAGFRISNLQGFVVTWKCKGIDLWYIVVKTCDILWSSFHLMWMRNSDAERVNWGILLGQNYWFKKFFFTLFTKGQINSLRLRWTCSLQRTQCYELSLHKCVSNHQNASGKIWDNWRKAFSIIIVTYLRGIVANSRWFCLSCKHLCLLLSLDHKTDRLLHFYARSSSV